MIDSVTHQKQPLPPIAGMEAELLALMQQPGQVAAPYSNLKLEQLQSAFACALHMHQPTIPAAADGELISHLQYMFEHREEGDNHNAEPFAQCYKRMAEIIPNLINEGCNPRIMLDYSGTLLWGFSQMGRQDILAALKKLACDQTLYTHVEWLGSFWSHAVAPSTPIPDLKLQIQAWQHQFANLFGQEALQRVRGFSLPEMHLPNNPDTLYALVCALRECGYRWLLVQEHSVENLDGSSLSQAQKIIPNQLVARNSHGETTSIIALIKTQGSDTKLVAQMQPYHEALGLTRQQIGTTTIPALVSQIADGENGGVMMNEFPPAFIQANRMIANTSTTPTATAQTVAINGTEYLELLDNSGVNPAEFPSIQAIGQHSFRAGDTTISMEGASWTNNISWVEGYEGILEPMQQLSARFHQIFDPLVANDPAVTKSARYQEALLHVLLLETSCFRYWGHGTWTDYAKTIQQRGEALL